MKYSSSSTYSQKSYIPFIILLFHHFLFLKSSKGIHYPFVDQIIFPAVLQLSEILVCVNNFLEFLYYLALTIGSREPTCSITIYDKHIKCTPCLGPPRSQKRNTFQNLYNFNPILDGRSKFAPLLSCIF